MLCNKLNGLEMFLEAPASVPQNKQICQINNVACTKMSLLPAILAH